MLLSLGLSMNTGWELGRGKGAREEDIGEMGAMGWGSLSRGGGGVTGGELDLGEEPGGKSPGVGGWRGKTSGGKPPRP